MSLGIAGRNQPRGSRVKVGGALLALILLENGRHIRARISQLSVNGGLLALEHPLDEGIRVTVVFHVGSTSIRSRAEMLFPMWATKGCLQPFRLRDLDQQLRAALLQELEALINRGAPYEASDAPEEVTGSRDEESETANMPQQNELAAHEPALIPQASEPAPQAQAAAQEHQFADSFMGEQPPESPSPNSSGTAQSAPE